MDITPVHLDIVNATSRDIYWFSARTLACTPPAALAEATATGVFPCLAAGRQLMCATAEPAALGTLDIACDGGSVTDALPLVADVPFGTPYVTLPDNNNTRASITETPYGPNGGHACAVLVPMAVGRWLAGALAEHDGAALDARHWLAPWRRTLILGPDSSPQGAVRAGGGARGPMVGTRRFIVYHRPAGVGGSPAARIVLRTAPVPGTH
jgi:hypothetical protein